MEVGLSIIGILVVLFLIGHLMVRGKIKRYRRVLTEVMDMMDTRDYKQSVVYKERVKVIEEQGITATLHNFMNELRVKIMQEYKLAPDFFMNTLVQDAEALFMMKYAVVHGYADEFQKDMEVGKILLDSGKRYKS